MTMPITEQMRLRAPICSGNIILTRLGSALRGGVPDLPWHHPSPPLSRLHCLTRLVPCAIPYRPIPGVYRGIKFYSQIIRPHLLETCQLSHLVHSGPRHLSDVVSAEQLASFHAAERSRLVRNQLAAVRAAVIDQSISGGP